MRGIFIPVPVTVQNAICNIPRADSNVEAVEYAVEVGAWSIPPAALDIN
jgi:hypothetical protein